MKNIKYITTAIFLMSFYVAFSQDNTTDSAFAQSERAEAKQDYKGAIAIMNKVYNPTSYEINLRIGWLNYEAGQYTEAQISYEKAINLMPNSIEPRLGYATVANALGNANELETQYTKVLEINPDNSYANYWIGMVYYNKKDYQTALPYFQKVLSLYPFDYSSLLMAGWTQYGLGKTVEAKALLEKVLCISINDKSAGEVIAKMSDASNSPGSQVNMLPSVFSQSESSEANKDYKAAIDIINKAYDKSSYEINLRLGWLNYEAGQNVEAESFYKKAIDLMPNSIEPRLGYATVANALGNVNDLIAQYTKILTIDPQNSYANYWLGMVYYNKKDYQTARPYFEKVVSLYPFDYDGLNMDAWTKYKLGKIAEAKALFEKILLISSGDSSAQYGLRMISEAK
jgi:tetratricopeptide (TPR) repeat protein